MPTLIYIHGFLSSPQSFKAQCTQKWLSYHRPDWQYLCPFLSSKPSETKLQLDALVDSIVDDCYLVGSSLGGFWASYLTEKLGFKSVLINPAVSPQTRFKDLVGQPLANYHTDEVSTLDETDMKVLAAADPSSLSNSDLYWLLVQTGDETLDYRMAVDKFNGCRQTIEEGGNHSFEGFEAWLPELIEFFES